MTKAQLASLKAPRTLVDQTHEVVLGAICDGTLKPGERLTQEDIAARLQVSRQPVMHALAMLKAQGLVIESGRRGLAVAPVDPRLFEAIYQLRSAVDPLAARLATDRLDAEAIAEGSAILAQGKAMVEAGDSAAVLRADIAFHSFIYERSGNPMIVEAMRLNWQHLRRGMGEVLRFPGMSISVWQEHAAILDAMIRGDADAAGRLMEDHIASAVQRVVLPAVAEGIPAEEAAGAAM